MDWNDTGSLAPDALQQFVGSLPSHWHIGLVTFHAEVIDTVAPGPNTRPAINEILSGTAYTGWTDAGAGLRQAMDLFSVRATSRTILFVTDGEKAHMPTPAATAEVAYLSEIAIAEVIASGIQVHTIVIGQDFAEKHESIVGLAPATGGHLFEDVFSEDLSSVVSQLTFDVLGVSSSLVGTAQMADGAGNFTVRLPASGVDSARVLITGESAIENIAVSGGGNGVVIQAGQRFSIVEIANPTEQVIDIAFTASGTTNAELILEWDLQLMAEVFPREGALHLWLSDSTGTNVLLDPFFSERTLPVSVDGLQTQARVDEGYIRLETEAADDTNRTVQIHLDSLGINMAADSPEIVVDIPAPPERVWHEATVLIVTLAGLLIAIVLLLIYFRPRRTQASRLTPGFESKFEFTGKLSLYVTRTPDDSDIPPQTFDLFRLDGKREISLQTILEKCRIPSSFSGVEQIYFVAGKQGSLQVVNDSDCTVLIGSNILMKKRGHMLAYGEKIHITCADEVSELELHYKSVKPSEKKALANPLIRYTDQQL